MSASTQMTTIKEKKLNDTVVRKVQIENINENVKGADMFPILYPNVFIAASKNSGKTMNIYNIINNSLQKGSIIFVFCSSHYNDQVWQKIKELCEKKEIIATFYTDLVNEGINTIQAIIESIKEIAAEREQEQEEEQPPDLFHPDEEGNMISVKVKKERKPKYNSPEYTLIFDDMAGSLTNPDIAALVKRNRHFHCRTIMSSQDGKDIRPATISNMDYLLLYPNITQARLEHIYEALGMNHITFDDFKKLYYHATSAPYNFLYIDRKTGKFRHNYDKEISLGW